MSNFKDLQNYESPDEWEDPAFADLIDQADPKAELEQIENLPAIRNMPQPQRRRPRKRHRKNQGYQVRQELADPEPSLDFTYNVQRDSHERIWLEDSLGSLLHLGWLSDVLRQVKGGKEASVYLCAGSEMTGEEYIAAKIYRPRMFRNLRNDSLYREGRANLDADGNTIIDHGILRAIEKKTRIGQRMAHTSWIEHEFRTMQILHKAGVSMPAPYARGDNAILMQYIGCPVLPAPTLNTVDLEPDEAQALFHHAITQVDLMLSQNRIHGDYSAYNILYWEGQLWVIDFPHAVSPSENRSAYQLLERDLQRICEYFAVQGVESDSKHLAAELWQKYHGRHRVSFHPGLLDPEDEDDLAFWDQQQEH